MPKPNMNAYNAGQPNTVRVPGGEPGRPRRGKYDRLPPGTPASSAPPRIEAQIAALDQKLDRVLAALAVLINARSK